MEILSYRFEHGTRVLPAQARLVGVVGSGNLEVLIESVPQGGACSIEVTTMAVGFGLTWEAVMQDFHARWQLADARIAINDVGATPAVVSLRLDQAVQTMLGEP